MPCATPTPRDSREAAGRLGVSEAFADYGEMLASPDLEAVLVGTPMPYHAAQAIAALERGIHVISEVPAAVSVGECHRIIEACKRELGSLHDGRETTATRRPNQIVKQMVREGVFGKPYYAEGEYIHELKPLNEVTKWRRRWQTGIDGITYGTHSLGPILQWMPGDRVTSVCLRRQRLQPRRPTGRLVREPGLVRDAVQDGVRRPGQDTGGHDLRPAPRFDELPAPGRRAAATNRPVPKERRIGSGCGLTTRIRTPGWTWMTWPRGSLLHCGRSLDRWPRAWDTEGATCCR